MRLSPGRLQSINGLLLVLFATLEVNVSSALSPDPRLLPLIPPSSKIVAGMRAPTLPGQPDSLLLITHNNTVDLADFFALTGADESRVIHQVIFAASADGNGILSEHSLLVSGHFDQRRIFRSASGAAKTSQYRGFAVLEVPPFERERSTISSLRWLAVIDSNVALFGTVASIEQELDRHLAGGTLDRSIAQRLARLWHDDDTWCLLVAPGSSEEIRHVWNRLDPAIAGLFGNGGAFAFGIRYGRRIEFEYGVTTHSSSEAQAVSRLLTQSLAGVDARESPILPRISTAENDERLHGIVKLSRSRYYAWLTGISAHSTSLATPSP